MNNMIPPMILGFKRAYGFLVNLPFILRSSSIPKPSHISHQDWTGYLSEAFNKAGLRVLEIGSRNVTGANRRNRFTNATYVGFDFHPGENVDVVGDAHKLSTYFANQEKFDLIFSSATFEHLHMPWIAALEIQKLLKVGGHVFIETHFSYRSHERPWHFFQFSDMGLRALFNHSLGFDLVESGMSNPLRAYFNHEADNSLKYYPVDELYCHSEILCIKSRDVPYFDWNDVDMDGVVDGSRYPPPNE